MAFDRAVIQARITTIETNLDRFITDAWQMVRRDKASGSREESQD